MANKKFCDIHPKEEGRETPEDSIRTLIMQVWQKIDGKNVLFENRLDVCMKCNAEIVARAKPLNPHFENNWKTTVLKKGKSGKWFRQALTSDEYSQYLREQAIAEEKQELLELRASMGK